MKKITEGLVKAIEMLKKEGLPDDLLVKSLKISEITLYRIIKSDYDYEKYRYYVRNKDKKVEKVEPKEQEYIQADNNEFLQLILIELRKANQNLDELKELLSKRRIF